MFEKYLWVPQHFYEGQRYDNFFSKCTVSVEAEVFGGMVYFSLNWDDQVNSGREKFAQYITIF